MNLLKKKVISRTERGSNTKPKTPGTMLPRSKTMSYGRDLTQRALIVPCQRHRHSRRALKAAKVGEHQPSTARTSQTQELKLPIWAPCNPASVREATLTSTQRKIASIRHKNVPESPPTLQTMESKEDTLESEHQGWADRRSNDDPQLNHHTSRKARRPLPCIQRSAAVDQRPKRISTHFTTQATQQRKYLHYPIYPTATGPLQHTRHPFTNPNTCSS